MNFETLETMIEVDEDHPWYKARMVLINEIISNDLLKNSSILDFGCGSGAVLEMLKNKGYANIQGMDVSKACVNLVKSRGIKAGLIRTDMLNLGKDKYDFILLLDVLEHIEKDSELLKNLATSLRDNGKILITVPAHQFLWRPHDDANHHFRRYSKIKLVKLIYESNFKIISVRWWNSTLFVGFMLVSLYHRVRIVLNRSAPNLADDFKIPSAFISKILLKILSFESRSKAMGKFLGVTLVAYIKK
jgi:2-polyprenyl-3-methyl-5-hydroxy-6-metoxy-1,4-benzoquinol methylase